MTEVPIHITALVSEEPLTFGGHTFTARRNTEPENDGTWRWQVFRDSALVGYLQSHDCPDFGETRLYVYDAANAPLYTAKPGRDDGCVGHYRNALVAFLGPFTATAEDS